MAASMYRNANRCGRNFKFNIKQLFGKHRTNLDYLLSTKLFKQKSTTKASSSFQFCVDTVRKYDYENYLCTLLLPPNVRSSAFVIRAFNVEISQVRELVSSPAIGYMRMKFWKDALEKTLSGHPPEQPVAKELAKVLQLHQLSKTWLQRLIGSREDVLNDDPFLSVNELEQYCENSVASVFYLILQASGFSNIHCDHAASHVGKAQGICNYIRAIPYNASKERLFLPLEIMSKHKVSQQDMLHGNFKENLQNAVFELATVAHQHLSLGRSLRKEVPAKARSVFLPAVSTKSFLDKLEKVEFDIFHPSLQRRNNWLPFSLYVHRLRKLY